MTSVRFAEEPKGEVSLHREGTQVQRLKPTASVARDVCKLVFSAEPIKKLAGVGQWFEIRVEDFSGASLSLMAIGFTATPPASLTESADEGEEKTLPGRPNQIPKTYVAGYARSAFWDGEHMEIDPVFEQIKPFKIFTVGALCTSTGALEIYIDRKLALEIDPIARNVQQMPMDEPLWAVLDCSGGLKKATLLTDSLAPSPDELSAESPAPPDE
mmetsp:Transcript_63395/g.182501  ORF Transcript_63395/g.182501 Transcript_63395/m.182501 type:complete len:214 (-) Transcript_63395:168-809(-)